MTRGRGRGERDVSRKASGAAAVTMGDSGEKERFRSFHHIGIFNFQTRKSEDADPPAVARSDERAGRGRGGGGGGEVSMT